MCLNVPVADEDSIYYKGDVFEGRLFGRFTSVAARDVALRKFRMAKPTLTNTAIRCKPDLKFEKRFPYSVLFGLKYLLGTVWRSHASKEIRVDLDHDTVSVQGHLAMTIDTESGEPKIRYEAGWEKWLQHQEWAEIVDNAAERSRRAKEVANQ